MLQSFIEQDLILQIVVDLKEVILLSIWYNIINHSKIHVKHVNKPLIGDLTRMTRDNNSTLSLRYF